MRARSTYTDADVRRFIALARGGRDSRRDVLDAMRQHPAAQAHPGPHTTPPLTNADGSPSVPLPAADPEKE